LAFWGALSTVGTEMSVLASGGNLVLAKRSSVRHSFGAVADILVFLIDSALPAQKQNGQSVFRSSD